MSKVTRYSGMGSVWTMPSDNGSYVKYEDYAVLESRCAEQDEKLRMINELTGAVEQVNKLAHEATERLIQERNALAAENAALSKFIDDECYVYGPHDVEPVDAALEKPETPATEAFLAEVREQGVEMAMEHMKSSGSLTFGDCYISLNEFAAKLRRVASSTMLQGAEPVTDNMNKQFESLSRGDK